MIARRAAWLAQARWGPLAAFLDPDAGEVGAEPVTEAGSRGCILAVFRLQDEPDYRAALQNWFAALRVGGRLVVVTPHAFLYERQLAPPSRWNPHGRRLYTPASLAGEVEEALEPNTYRVRHLADHDEGYTYGDGDEDGPVAGRSEVVLVLERIAPPSWPVRVAPAPPGSDARQPEPDYRFGAVRTRVETVVRPVPTRIFLMKLDHLGDFILGLGALERARALFPAAEITLAVASWNVDMARDLGLADRVIGFDAFPRNSSEEEVDVPGKAALFARTVSGEYDLAIDLRTDGDTRTLLRRVRATRRAGVGDRAHFPFLDIFLPLDQVALEVERANEVVFTSADFSAQGSARQTAHRISSDPGRVERDCAIVWGPYRRLRPGRYLFDPYLEVAEGAGLLRLDVALEARSMAERLIGGEGEAMRIAFEVVPEQADARFEFRIRTVDEEPSLPFSFFGGRLVREGLSSVLHQSEIPSLLMELVALRLARTGALAEMEMA